VADIAVIRVERAVDDGRPNLKGSGAKRQHEHACLERAVSSSTPEHGTPNCGRSSASNSETSWPELPLADAVHQLDTGDRDRRMTELLEAEHHSDTLLDAPMVLLNQIIQVLRRSLLRIRWQGTIGFHLSHCATRCGVAVQRDGLWWVLVVIDRFAEEGLRSGYIAPGAQPEVDCPSHPIDGTVQITPLTSDLDVCLVNPPRPAHSKCQPTSGTGPFSTLGTGPGLVWLP
jgi:hypothetical protein